ncbi:MAG: hypothetical protein ACE366_28520 [Bradymonadia bacterium]
MSNDRRRGREPRVTTATKDYKRSLDAFFDRGVVPEHLKERMAEAGLDGEASPDPRTKALRAVRAAESGPKLIKAIDALRKEHGLPDDMEILLRVLEHPKDEVLREALDLIEPYVELGNPLPKKRQFIQKLKGLEFSSFDPRVQRKAVDIARQAGG